MNLVLFFLSTSLITITIYYLKLIQSLAAAPKLPVGEEINLDSLKVSTIVPVYNEADNIADCLRSILQSTSLPSSQLEVIVIDDSSTDNTLEIAFNLAAEMQDSRLSIIAGEERPQEEKWVGKNWACDRASRVATGDYILFVDADVRLKKGAIEAAVGYASENKIDLLSLLMAIDCDCMAEWLVQPIMINLLAIGFDYATVNDPESDRAFAAGPFMLFRREAYDRIGGHRAVSSEVVEDVELAKKIKRDGLKLQVLLGSDFISARMYRDWASLWEGWTKNFYLGSERQILPMLQVIVSVLLIYTVPWLGLLAIVPHLISNNANNLDYLSLVLIISTIVLQYRSRNLGGKSSYTPNNYWWLSGLGGIIVAAIVVASVIKTETGWGWTWRGRQLQ